MVMPYLNEEQTSAETIAEFRGYNHNPVTEQNEFYDMENMTGDKFPLIATRNKRGEDILNFYWDGHASYAYGRTLCAFLKGDMRFVFFKFTGNTGAKKNVFIRVNDKDSNHGYRIFPTDVEYIEGHHYVVAMGAQLILFPEKIIVNIKEDWYDTAKYTSASGYIEKIEASVTASAGSPLTVTVCYNLNGDTPSNATTGTTAPEIRDTQYIISDSSDNPTAASTSYDIYTYDTDSGRNFSGTITYRRLQKLNGSIVSALTSPGDRWWYETSQGGTYDLHRYDSRMGWTAYSTYLKIGGITAGTFKEGDAVKISGFLKNDSEVKFNKDVKSYVIEKVDGTYIYVKVALTTAPSTVAGNYTTGTISRVMPNLDFVIEVNNRLWGCRFGESLNGEYINEIFASKLGDPKNWYYFANTAEDAYYVTLPNAGKFTGAVNYQNNPVFFRENCLHRITGTYPGNFRMSTMVCNGVKESNNESLCVLNDICYYMSPYGMCAYNGGIPISLAEAFGDIDYANVKCDTAATCNELYCLMTGIENAGIYVFDDSKAFWHRESIIPIETGDTVRLADNSKEVVAYSELATVESTETGIHTSMSYLATQANSYTDESDLSWHIQTAEIGYMSPYHKRLNKLLMKLRLAYEGKARIEIQYDRDGVWHYVNELRPTGRFSSYSVPVSPQRCDTFSIKISGKGEFSLIAITKFWAEGSDSE